jgi:hypothetical protein
MTFDLDLFTRQYIATALWSSNDESTPQGGEPMDANYSVDDISEDALERIKADCAKFQAENADTLSEFDAEQTGHDFWLTRNHHGAGFWDGDYPEPAATILDNASKAFGECDLYIGDDGKVYIL